jgi:hypothetical protein
MGWSTGKDPESLGKYGYVLWDGFNTIHTVGGFDTMQEADQAGARANTNWLVYGITDPEQTLEARLAAHVETLAELLDCLKDTPIKD